MRAWRDTTLLITILGGTFDPIHTGHLHVANAVSEALGNTTILLMLAPDPQLRSKPHASVKHRWSMLKLVCRDYTHLEPSDIELARDGVTKTIDTLRLIRAQNPEPVTWILGSDAVSSISRWHGFKKLPQLMNIIAAQRPNTVDMELPIGFEATEDKKQLFYRNGQYYVLRVEMLNISATEVRKTLFLGKDVSQWVPNSVLNYIIGYSLYRRRTFI